VTTRVLGQADVWQQREAQRAAAFVQTLIESQFPSLQKPSRHLG
jgi:gluconate kinase